MSDYEFWGLPGEDLFGDPFDSRLDRKLRRKMLGAHICFGGGKGGGKAPAPDPQIGQAALKQAETGQQWLEFAKDQFAIGNQRQEKLDELANRVGQKQAEMQDYANEWAIESNRRGEEQYRWALEERKKAQATGEKYAEKFNEQAGKQYEFADQQQQRYKDTFQPIEDRLAKDAMSWDSEERQAEMAAQARADVMSNSAMAQQQQSRQLASMGVDPRSGRFQGAGRATTLQTALASAGAQNAARDATRSQAIAMRGQAAGLGQGIAAQSQQANAMGMQATGQSHQAILNGQSQAMQWQNIGNAAGAVGHGAATMSGIGLSAGSAAMGTSLGANSAFQQNTAMMGQGFGGAMQGYAGQANTLNNLYGSQLQGWSAQQQAAGASAAGLFSGIGTLAGAALIASSKDYKEDKQPVGGALAAVESMPVEQWKYKDGIADGGKHIGPYAEDFQAATGKGDGKSIPVQDAIGVTMAAVQELSANVKDITDQVKVLGRKKNVMAGGIA